MGHFAFDFARQFLVNAKIAISSIYTNVNLNIFIQIPMNITIFGNFKITAKTRRREHHIV